jgi:flagellar biosynthetic protein FliR
MDRFILEEFLLIFVRTTAFMFAAPFFSIRNVPVYIKVSFGLILAALLYPVLNINQVAPDAGSSLYWLSVIQETLVGLILGFTATLAFSAIRMAGQFIDLHIGFAMAGLFDPVSGVHTTLIGEFLYIMAMLLFFVLDGHHTLLILLSRSYEAVPLMGAVFEPALAGEVAAIFYSAFALGFKIAAPIITVMFISDISLSLISRTVPQLNVFITGFPLKVGFGFLALIVFIPLFANLVGGVVSEMQRALLKVMGAFP